MHSSNNACSRALVLPLATASQHTMKLIRPALRLCLHVGVFCFSGLIASPSAQTLPANWPADYPDWWYNAADPANGVIDATLPLLNQNNDAALNQGQLWNIAQQSIDELNTQLAPIGGAGFEIDDLSNGQSPDYYAPANVGQIKNAASHFFGRFVEVGFTPASVGWPIRMTLDPATGYPWSQNQTPANLAPANLGQAKHLWSWNLEPWVSEDSEINDDSTFGDGLPDWWERYWFGDLAQTPASDSDSDGLSDLVELRAAFNPTSTANGTGLLAVPDVLSMKLNWGEQHSADLLLNNPTGSDISYSITTQGGTGNGYSWQDSLTGSAAYRWYDISAIGTSLITIADVDSDSELITLNQFTFPYYGRGYTEVWVSSNGYLNFKQEVNYQNNYSLPEQSYRPHGALAAFWDDLDTAVGGDIYYLETSTSLTVQYETVAKDDGSGTNTFQIVLHADGSIDYFYKELNGDLDECTVGLQNVSRNQGFQLAYNETYLQNSMAIRFESTAPLFTVAPLSGIVSASSSAVVTLDVDTSNLVAGSYPASLEATHSGVAGTLAIPLELEIPYAKITEPAAGTTLFEGETLSTAGAYLRARVIDTPDAIDRVEFRTTGGLLINTDIYSSNSEYYVNWYSVPAGEHQVFARVILDDGRTNDSAPIMVIAIPDSDDDALDDRWEQYYFGGFQEIPLGDFDQDGASNLHEYEAGTDPDDDADTPANAASVISITEPTRDLTLLETDTQRLQATYTDSDFGADRIEFWSSLDAQNPIATDTSVSSGSAWVNWTNVTPGIHNITAKAIDRYGAVSIAATYVTITVFPDSDADCMDDDWELASFGDLAQEASADFDGDRFPNIFEYHHGTDAGTQIDAELSFPVFADPQTRVSPVTAVGDVYYYRVDGVSNSTYEKSTIQAAINAANDFDIIEVLPGTYNEDIYLGERLLLYGRDYARTTIIDGTGRSDSVIDLYSECVIDGFTIQHGGSTTTVYNGAGVYASIRGSQNKPRLVGCLLANNTARSQGGAIYISSGDLTLVSCSLIDNAAPEGAAIYSGSNSNNIELINTLLWNHSSLNHDEVEGSIAGIVYQNTLYRDGATRNAYIDAVDQNTSNPGITSYNGIYANSPAKDAGIATEYSITDYDGEVRDDGFIDIGVDEAVDTDGDGIVDAWMIFYGLTDPNGHTDTDTLTNLEEYQYQTNPLDADTDRDSVNDSDEIFVTGTNPLVADTEDLDSDLNQDGIDDSIGLTMGISLAEINNDRDSLTNAQELALGTDPTLADTDGDGALDGTDEFPLDPNMNVRPTNASDAVAPILHLELPPQAIAL